MPDELIEQYQRNKTRLDIFFEWLNNLPIALRLFVFLFIILTASYCGYLIGLLIKTLR